MRESGVSGLDFTYGHIYEDPDYKLRGQLGIAQYDLMRYTDPTVSAILMALTLPVREAKWRVNPASAAGPDVEAAEFVESCLHDMSFTWDDVLTEICTMFTFGWGYMEWVLKPRLGPNPKGGGAPSTYNDGRIGFKKLALRGQSSLHMWNMDDDTGKLYGMKQWAGTKILNIPLEKAILFRTTKELNNPEGFSVLRPAHRAWTYKRQIERIEAIGIQRAMQGLPVVKLLSGATREGHGDPGVSTEERGQDIIKQLYTNTMLGVIEDEDMEFRFEAPDMRGIAQDSSRVIQRYDEAIARSVLAMYILLGSRERGSYALAQELGDLFFLSVEGFINMISQTFSKWGIPILFRYNSFPGITGFPEVATAINRRVDLEALSNFINATVQAQVLSPDEELERHVRELANLPAPAVQVGGEAVTPAEEEATEGKSGAPSAEGQKAESGRASASRQDGLVAFAARGGLKGYRRSTDAYKAELRADYDDWVDEVEKNIKAHSPEDEGLADKWETWVALGLLLMQRKGWQRLPEAFIIGYQSTGLSAAARGALDAEIMENDRFLAHNLWTRVGRSINVHELDEIARLYAAGETKEAEGLLKGKLGAIRGNVGQYAGAYWRTIWVASILRNEEEAMPVPGEELEGYEPAPITWNLDAVAKHCGTCLMYGGRTYADMEDLLATTGGVLPGNGTECDGNCRCWLTSFRAGAWGLL